MQIQKEKNYESPKTDITELVGEEMMDITSPGGIMDGGNDEANMRMESSEIAETFNTIW